MPEYGLSIRFIRSGIRQPLLRLEYRDYIMAEGSY